MIHLLLLSVIVSVVSKRQSGVLRPMERYGWCTSIISMVLSTLWAFLLIILKPKCRASNGSEWGPIGFGRTVCRDRSWVFGKTNIMTRYLVKVSITLNSKVISLVYNG